MYIYIIKRHAMKRTQIYLDEETYSILKNESKIADKTISEIIRSTIRNKYQYKTCDTVRKMNAVFGMWRKSSFDTDGYIRLMRKDRSI